MPPKVLEISFPPHPPIPPSPATFSVCILIVLLVTTNDMLFAVLCLADPTVTLTSSPSEGNTIFNAQLILTCSYDTAGMPVAVGVVQWFINGAPVDETNSTNSQSEMTVDKLVTDGYYQCLVVTQDGEAAGAIALVYPQRKACCVCMCGCVCACTVALVSYI